jgi:hypothetical protein
VSLLTIAGEVPLTKYRDDHVFIAELTDSEVSLTKYRDGHVSMAELTDGEIPSQN